MMQAWAITRPRPRAPPVMTTVRPRREKEGRVGLLWGENSLDGGMLGEGMECSGGCENCMVLSVRDIVPPVLLLLPFSVGASLLVVYLDGFVVKARVDIAHMGLINDLLLLVLRPNLTDKSLPNDMIIRCGVEVWRASKLRLILAVGGKRETPSFQKNSFEIDQIVIFGNGSRQEKSREQSILKLMLCRRAMARRDVEIRSYRHFVDHFNTGRCTPFKNRCRMVMKMIDSLFNLAFAI